MLFLLAALMRRTRKDGHSHVNAAVSYILEFLVLPYLSHENSRMNPNARILLTFHHILSKKKKAVITSEARKLGLVGICKVGYPGVLAVEGKEVQVLNYVREIKVLAWVYWHHNFSSFKSMRWASCTQAAFVTGLFDSDLKMSNATSLSGTGVEMVEKMADVGLFMRKAGLENWWKTGMGYTRGG